MLVDLKCMSFNFISSVNLGWNSFNEGSLFWKDWTFVGIDLSSYVGQNLKIQITNYDCEKLKILYNVDSRIQANNFINLIVNMVDVEELNGLDFNFN